VLLDQDRIDVALDHRVARDAHVGVPNAPGSGIRQAGRDARAGARKRLGLELRVAWLAVLDDEPRDRAIIDRLEDFPGILRHRDFLSARPDVEARMIPKRPPDVEEEVVGIDKEVESASAVEDRKTR
jgi:hypothetical protein